MVLAKSPHRAAKAAFMRRPLPATLAVVTCIREWDETKQKFVKPRYGWTQGTLNDLGIGATRGKTNSLILTGEGVTLVSERDNG